MGRKITIIGADFSAVAVHVADVEYTESQLLTQQGAYKVLRNNPKSLEYTSNSSWRSIIMELHDDMYVENACALKLSKVGVYQADTPAIIFLSSNSISGYIQNSEVYTTSGGDENWGIFSGTLNPPTGATHVIIQTLLPSTGYGDLDSIISWSESSQ